MMVQRKIPVAEARVLIMGVAFKENCPDIRNSRVQDVIAVFEGYQAQVDVYYPWVSPMEAEHYYGFRPVDQPEQASYDAIILCVAHDVFREMGGEANRAFGREKHVLYDVQYILDRDEVDGRL